MAETLRQLMKPEGSLDIQQRWLLEAGLSREIEHISAYLINTFGRHLV